MTRRMLVLGADPGSLGFQVRGVAESLGWDVDFTGLSDPTYEMPDNYRKLDASYSGAFSAINFASYETVVSCIGRNEPTIVAQRSDRYVKTMQSHFIINTMATMEAAHRWAMSRAEDRQNPGSFVAVSSNSAHIARSESAAYCMSKAALSMGIRCLARDMSKLHMPGALYGYEPCWIDGTNMSDSVLTRLPAGVAPHRVPGDHGIDARKLAEMIVVNLSSGHSDILHGTMLAVDLGDQ